MIGEVAEVAAPLVSTEVVPADQKIYTLRELDGIIKRLVKHGTLTRQEVDDLRRLPPKAKAYIAKTQGFHDFLLAAQWDEAMGFRELTKGQARAVRWFLGTARRIDPQIQGKGTAEPYIDVTPEGVDDGGADGV